MVDQNGNGRSQSSTWRALHAEGILWDGPVSVVDGASELPLRLIATGSRLAFAKGGEFALEIPRDWLRPAPFLNPDGSISLTVDAGENARPERLRIIARDGRRTAVDLIAALHASRPPRAERSTTIYAPDELPEALDAPAPPSRGRRAKPPVQTSDFSEDEALLGLLDLDDFPPLSGAPERTRPLIIIDDDLPDEALAAGPLVAPARDGEWSLQPLTSMSSRFDRQARRGWAIRLSGLIVLLTFAAALTSGNVPELPGRDLGSHIPDTNISAPFGLGDPGETATAEVALLETPESLPTNETAGLPNQADGAPTLPASETAIALGVGGMDPEAETAVVTLTPEPTATPTEEPSPTPSPTETAQPEPTAEPTNEPVVEAAEEPEPTATVEPTLEPTAEPTDEPTVEPTATTEPSPTLEPTSEPTLEPTPEPTLEPTLEPTVEPSVEPSATATLAAPTAEATLGPSETPSPTLTPTIEPTATPTVEPSPTPTPTEEPAFPSQAATLGEGELPAQVLTGGQFRYTIESVIQSPTIDSVALTAVPGSEWLLIYLHAENWSDVEATLAPGGLQVLTYGSYGVASTFPDPVSTVIGQTLGLDPALGPADAITLAPGEGLRMALAYLVLPGTTELQLTTGLTTMDLAPVIGQSDDIFNPGDAPEAPELIAATVTRILDGQSIMVQTEDGARARVRYLGVQAPTGTACYAEESINANAALTLGKTVYLERERKNRAPNSQIARDVWIVGDDGSLTLVAAVLAAEGSVVAAPVEPDIRFAGWIQAAADGAEFNVLGLWAACGGLVTPEPEPTEAPSDETPVAEIQDAEPALLMKRLFE